MAVNREPERGLLAISFFLAGMATAAVAPEFSRLDLTWRLGSAGVLILLAVLTYVAAVRDRRHEARDRKTLTGTGSRTESEPWHPGSGGHRHVDRVQRALPTAEPPLPADVARHADQVVIDPVVPEQAATSFRDIVGAASYLPDKTPFGEVSEQDESGSELGGDPATDGPDEAPQARLRDVLVEAWRNYLLHGDGHFGADGLRAQLEALGIEVVVRGGSVVGAGDAVLVVEAGRDDDSFLVVPSFTKSPGAAPDWFLDESDGALGHRTKELRKLAEGRWANNRFEIVAKGVVA